MHILRFIADNWNDILVAILLIAACYTGIRQWIKVKGPLFMSMSGPEKIAYITRLLTNLIPSAWTLITDAEVKFGGGTGVLKRAYVIDELYKRIPDEYKKYITEDNLDSIINKVLPEVKKLWAENTAVKSLMEAQTETATIKYAAAEQDIGIIAEKLCQKQQNGKATE